MSSFPVTRLRRFRRTSGLRGLVRETRLSLEDFVMPLFVGPEAFANDDLPGLRRHSLETVAREADDLVAAGVKSVILFGIPEDKDDEGSGAWDDDGIVQHALRALRERHDDLVLITDVCLCEYTSHGHCGVLDGDEGADMLMVKPALPCLDVIRAVREEFDLPLAAYNVSGEYAMIKAAAAKGLLDERQAALESLTAIKRAGADVIVSYWTKELASWL